MSRIIVRTPGQGLTLPEEILQAVGLSGQPIGAKVEVEIKDGGIFLSNAESKDDAQARIEGALQRIIERSKEVSLEGLSLKELINEGRRG